MKLPSRDSMNAHIWRLAALVHPFGNGMDRLTWIQKVLARHGVDAQTIDGQLDYRQGYLLWNCLLNEEISRSNTMMELLEREELAPT